MPSWLSSAVVAALVSAVFLVIGTWVNGWRQRLFDAQQKEADRKRLEVVRTADREHEERLRRLQFDHERELRRIEDLVGLRDRKYERLRVAVQLIVPVADDLEMVIGVLINNTREERVKAPDRLAELVSRLKEGRETLVADEESETLRKALTGLITDTWVYLAQLGGYLQQVDVGRQVNPKLVEVLEKKESELLAKAKAISPASRALLAQFEKPVSLD